MSTYRALNSKGVPPLPMALIVLRFVIIALAVGILVACGYALSLTGVGVIGGAPGYMIFVVVKTLLVQGVVMALEKWAPQVYYRLAVIILYLISTVFWLGGWAWAASVAAFFFGFACDGDYSACEQFGAAMAASAGLGAIAWICNIVVLFLFIQACRRDPDGAAHMHHGAEMGNMKHGQQQQPYAPQPYAQQPYAQPQGAYPQGGYPQGKPSGPY